MNSGFPVRGLSFADIYSLYIQLSQLSGLSKRLELCVSMYRSQRLTLHIRARPNIILLLPFPLPENGVLFFKVSRAIAFSIIFIFFKKSIVALISYMFLFSNIF